MLTSQDSIILFPLKQYIQFQWNAHFLLFHFSFFSVLKPTNFSFFLFTSHTLLADICSRQEILYKLSPSLFSDHLTAETLTENVFEVISNPLLPNWASVASLPMAWHGQAPLLSPADTPWMLVTAVCSLWLTFRADRAHSLSLSWLR